MENTKDYVPYTPEHLRVKDILIDTARRKGVITYSELIVKAKLKLDMEIPYDRGQLGHLLGEISWNESLDGRPMLSSVAVTKHSFRHGQGFFDLAEEIYNINIPRGNNNEELTFGIPEMNKTHQFWGNIDGLM